MYVIKNYAISKLKEMRMMANMLYGKLEDWIFYTEQVENQAVFEMSKIFREAIEKTEKIQKEIQLNFVDVIISHETLNFLTPPVSLTPRPLCTWSKRQYGPALASLQRRPLSLGSG